MNKRALPEGFTIDKSDINGLGLFATRDLLAMTTAVTHIHHPVLGWLRTALGAFINHSDTPNLKKALDHRKYYLYTIVDIPMGSELTLKYEWYEVEGDDYEYERRDPTVIR